MVGSDGLGKGLEGLAASEAAQALAAMLQTQYLRYLIIILFNVLIAYYTFQIIQSQISTEQVSPSLRIPMWFAYGAVPVGAVLMAWRCIQMIGQVGKPAPAAASPKKGG